jgi:hypothetical protein
MMKQKLRKFIINTAFWGSIFTSALASTCCAVQNQKLRVEETGTGFAVPPPQLTIEIHSTDNENVGQLVVNRFRCIDDYVARQRVCVYRKGEDCFLAYDVPNAYNWVVKPCSQSGIEPGVYEDTQ